MDKTAGEKHDRRGGKEKTDQDQGFAERDDGEDGPSQILIHEDEFLDTSEDVHEKPFYAADRAALVLVWWRRIRRFFERRLETGAANTRYPRIGQRCDVCQTLNGETHPFPQFKMVVHRHYNRTEQLRLCFEGPSVAARLPTDRPAMAA
ncbi:hypothetical protein [Rhodomicrobium udaipurense]|uniref:hypothetical protein n=1 Tax=Rhodomicrobium udaipurense TaxID=1202716 RepID=UPI001AEEA870|nr:hypothetical protein [Rhodomicrobium udaipurense]